MKIAIIGGGAAGCFCAIELKRRLNNADIHIFEGGAKLLAKVAITGGGRCNLTNSFKNIYNLNTAYPRGDKLIKRVFHSFDYNNTINWFTKEGVLLVVQEDQCVFPCSQNAMQIVDCLYSLLYKHKVNIHTSYRVSNIDLTNNKFTLQYADSKLKPTIFDIVVITTGGYTNLPSYNIFNKLNLNIVPPVPSLFTFNIKDNTIKTLSGTVIENVQTALKGTKFKAQGPLLITDWGMSGPAILKLSSYGARFLADNKYNSTLIINWLYGMNEDQIRAELNKLFLLNTSKLVTSVHLNSIASRLWKYICYKSGIGEEDRCNNISKKAFNKLVNTLLNDEYIICGKGKFKEEFVTCGGIALNNINLNTLEAKNINNLYFAGEILDVDAITGGFNLQAAWSMGYVVAQSIALKHNGN